MLEKVSKAVKAAGSMWILVVALVLGYLGFKAASLEQDLRSDHTFLHQLRDMLAQQAQQQAQRQVQQAPSSGMSQAPAEQPKK